MTKNVFLPPIYSLYIILYTRFEFDIILFVSLFKHILYNSILFNYPLTSIKKNMKYSAHKTIACYLNVFKHIYLYLLYCYENNRYKNMLIV